MAHQKHGLTLLDPAVQQCPYRAYKELRDEHPVYLDPATGFHIISRFEDVKTVLKNPEIFGSAPMMESTLVKDGIRKRLRDNAIYEAKGWVPGRSLPFRDEPEHKQMRAVFDKAFRHSRIQELDGFIRDCAEKLVDSFVDKGSCDWVKDFAIPLPLIVICHQMGAPKEDIWKIKGWTEAFFHRIGMMQPDDDNLDALDKIIEAQHYFQPMFERLRQTPNDSFLSDLVNTVIEAWGRPLTDNELHASMMTDTFVGGSETTTNALGAGVMLLLENPDIWAQLKSDPEKYLPTFIEEVVRLESPVQGQYRFVREDTEIAGVPLEKGATLIIRFGAANRDDQKFDCPETINLERPRAAAHLGFGMGNHHCLGASLARRELYWGFKTLTERVTSMRPAEGQDGYDFHPHYLFRSLKTLNIEFEVER